MSRARFVSHSCGVTWQQVGNRTGHCAGCHRTFDDIKGFDAHQRIRAGRAQCLDPATLVRRDGGPMFTSRKPALRGADGLSRPDADTTYWRIRATEAQLRRFARLEIAKREERAARNVEELP